MFLSTDKNKLKISHEKLPTPFQKFLDLPMLSLLMQTVQITRPSSPTICLISLCLYLYNLFDISAVRPSSKQKPFIMVIVRPLFHIPPFVTSTYHHVLTWYKLFASSIVSRSSNLNPFMMVIVRPSWPSICIHLHITMSLPGTSFLPPLSLADPQTWTLSWW